MDGLHVLWCLLPPVHNPVAQAVMTPKLLIYQTRAAKLAGSNKGTVIFTAKEWPVIDSENMRFIMRARDVDLTTITMECFWSKLLSHIDGLVQERCHSSALAMELCLSCTNPSISWLI